MTKKTIRITFWLSILAYSLGGCGAQSAGPQAWIDKPFDGQKYPIGPVIIQAHASDSGGVASIVLFIDGQEVNRVATGGDDLGEAIVEWQAQEPGTYLIEVQAIDPSGIQGPPARAVIIVGDISIDTTPAHTDSPPVIHETPSSKPSSTSTSSPEPIDLVPINPAPTSTSPSPTSTPIPPPDTTPPTIILHQVDQTQILTDGGGCPDSARQATVTVVATDPSGIASATVFWNVSGDTGDALLSFVGSDTYQGYAGPVNQTGTMSLFVAVKDNTGNSALSGVLNLEVVNCIQ